MRQGVKKSHLGETGGALAEVEESHEPFSARVSKAPGSEGHVKTIIRI